MKWENPQCNLCGSKKTNMFLKDISTWEYPEKFNIVECCKCDLKFISPRPKKQYISKFYDEKSYWGEDLNKVRKITNHKADKAYSKIYKFIKNNLNQPLVFDAGAGKGDFLAALKNGKSKLYGNELSKQACKYAKKVYCLDLIQGDFNDVEIGKEKYDVITFNSTLEHMYNPKAAVKKAKYALKKRGVLIITVPNIDSLGFKILGRNWLPLHPPKHLYHFSQKTLTKMIEDAGLKAVKREIFIFNHAYYGVFNSFRYMMSPKFKSDQCFEEENGSNKKEVKKNHKISIKKEVGKLFFAIATFVIVLLGAILGKGETITIYAKKT